MIEQSGRSQFQASTNTLPHLHPQVLRSFCIHECRRMNFPDEGTKLNRLSPPYQGPSVTPCIYAPDSLLDGLLSNTVSKTSKGDNLLNLPRAKAWTFLRHHAFRLTRHATMVPSPLTFTSLSGRRYPLSLGGAISSAASPLQTSFQLNCRSPLSPRNHALDGETPRDAVKSSRGSSLVPPRLHQLPAESSAPIFVYSEEALDSVTTDDASSYTAYSPTDQSLFLHPTTPSVANYEDRPDEGKLGVISAISIIIGKTVGVGAYTIPSAIFDGVGSVGMTLLLWVIGSIISFCGLAVYLELGTAIPRSGGERVYLERIFRQPYMLATCMFMSYAVLLGFSTPNAIVLGDYALYALDIPRGRWNVRIIAALVVSAICYIHARCPKTGLRMVNSLAVSKLIILVFVILCGAVGGMMSVGQRVETGLEGRRLDLPMNHDWTMSTAQRNFHNIWEGSSMQPYDCKYCENVKLSPCSCIKGMHRPIPCLEDISLKASRRMKH